ncbi:MAG: alpha/beta fold hydrolase [Desulfovibrionaceae bacterium]
MTCPRTAPARAAAPARRPKRAILARCVLHAALPLLACAAMLLWGCATMRPAHQAAMPPITDHTATLDTMAVHYRTAGSGGVPLILIHGWGCDTSFWEGQWPLAQGRRVIAVDLPGHGQSDAPDIFYTQDLFARAVLAVMDHAGVQRAVLAGHSMGASVARLVALRAPKRVAAVILVDGALFFLPQDDAAVAAWLEESARFADMFEGPEGEAFAASFIDTLHGKDTPGALKATVRGTILATPRHVRLSAMRSFTDPVVWRGPPVQAPTLAVYAASPDTPPHFKAKLRAMFPHLEYDLWDGPGHFLMLEQPVRLNARITAFLAARAL